MRLILIISWCLFICGSFAVSQDLSAYVSVRNTPTSGAFKTYEKVEIGVKLPGKYHQQIENFCKKLRVPETDKLNPFLEWEVNVVACFQQPNSDSVIRIPAFYFVEFERDTIRNRYIEKKESQQMCIRFAPPKSGVWTAKIEMYIRGKRLDETPVVRFRVLDGTNPGYVKVHPNGRNLVLGENLFYPVGVNFPSPLKGMFIYHTPKNPGESNAYQPNETSKVAKPKDWLRYLKDIETYHQQGGNFIRVLQSPWSSLVEFEEKGNYTSRLHYAWEQDQLISFCEENGLYVQFNLMQQEPIMNYANYDLFDWDWWQFGRDGTYNEKHPYPPYCYSNGPKKEPHEMFLDSLDLKFHEQRLRYYMARYAYATAIYEFELLSEPWHLDQFWPNGEVFNEATEKGALCRHAVTNYHLAMATYIREHLPATKQLLGIELFTPNLVKGDEYIDSSCYSSYIDVIGFNPYSPVPEKLVITKNGDNLMVDPSENSMYKTIDHLHQKCHKPILISEGGGGDLDDQSDFAQQKLDMMAFAFCGVAGFNSWAGWNTNEERLWPNQIAIQNCLNDSLLPNVLMNNTGNWKQGRQAEKTNRSDKKKSKELQYYLSEDQLVAVGYVKNRTYNFHTQAKVPYTEAYYLKNDPVLGIARDISWRMGKPLTVQGLRKGAVVTITWYDYITGQVIEKQTVKSRKDMVLEHPVLTAVGTGPLRPMIWFKVEVQR
jgi:hypothetical protein